MTILRHKKVKELLRRSAAALLSLVLLSEVFLFTAPQTQAAGWADEYMQTMVDWGVLRDDIPGNMDPDHYLTRAEFVAMVNRAYGYTKVGPVPFQDISPKDWYYEDICIAYNVGYFTGFSETTAGPNSLLTREQAAVLIGRNMSLEQGTGEVLGFTDSRSFSNYSRHMIESVCNEGIISGYSDGSFRPKNNVTRGHVAAMLTRAVGTPLRETGEHVLGDVYGNVTIASSGTKLKDTTIYGNLYISGGVELGDVMLENVNVLGRITVCGTGESEKGENSVVLRNVNANELRIDNLNDQYLSLKADGLTSIDEVAVLTGAYLEDLVTDAQGLKNITLDAAAGAQFTLAGNIKEVINKTPGSTLIMGQGTAQVVTVDEKALESTVDIKNEVVLGKLNLDTATDVIGAGDITDAIVNTNGTVIEMLPENITVRPGIMADVAGEDMDSVGAKESSEDPRFLSGYPKAKRIAPKSADIVFKTNKKGTIYWALTALADGSVKEEDLIEPPAYANKILDSGTIAATASNTEFTAKVSGLTADGSYYVSAILVDDRGMRSAVKVTAFTTPDDTTPAFTKGYPTTLVTLTRDKEQVVQANVMVNKDCRMYYALLPKGSVAPTAAEFKASAITGNLGFGTVDLKKNTPFLVSKINSAVLKEVTEYDLYLWLTDIDGAKSSAVKKLTVKTLDITPPHIKTLTVTDVKAKSVTLSFSLDEPGTLFWAVVKDGKTLYTSNEKDFCNTDTAKAQVENGINAVKKGSAKAGKALTEYKFTISGLEAETAYDLYYVAKDTAGNYCVYSSNLMPPMDIHTLDAVAPTVRQEFNGKDEGSKPEPKPSDSISLVFSENVQGMHDLDAPIGTPDRHLFLELYQGSDVDKKKLASILPEYIKLYVDGEAEPVEARVNPEDTDWVIDYSKATVELSPDGSGEMIITFPYHADPAKSALNLAGGETYYFTVEYVADTSAAENYMKGEKNIYTLPKFYTEDARMLIGAGSGDGKTEDGQEIVFDMNFMVTPVTTASVNNSVLWDLILWSEYAMKIEVYYRDEGTELWKQLKADGSEEAKFLPTSQDPKVGISLSRELRTADDKKDTPNFEQLNTVIKKREYGIVVTELNGSDVRDAWSGSVSIEVVPIVGDKGSLGSLSLMCQTPEDYQEFNEKKPGAVKEFGKPTSYEAVGYFRDKTPPTFVDGTPIFDVGDSGANISVQLSRPDTEYFCVITEVGNITTVLDDGTKITKDNWGLMPSGPLPEDGLIFDGVKDGNVATPSAEDIVDFRSDDDTKYIVKHGKYNGSRLEIDVNGKLKANTKYIAYFVLKGGTAESISPKVFAFGFQTKKAMRPVISLTLQSPSVLIESDRQAESRYMMVVVGKEEGLLTQDMSEIWNPQWAEEYGGVSAETADEVRAMNVLEAMQTKVYVGDTYIGSGFDIFAKESARNTLSGWFQSAAPNKETIVKVGSVSLPANNKTVTVDCLDSMPEGSQQYWFIAMGKSSLGSSYAFAAVKPLQRPNSQHPKVMSISTDAPPTDDPKPDLKLYSGTVTVIFDSDLYFLEDGKYLQVLDKPVGSIINDAEKYYLSYNLLSKTGSNVSIVPQYEGRGPSDNPTCYTLTMKFTNMVPGSKISFKSDLATERGMTGNKALVLELKLVKNEFGNYKPEFVIEKSAAEWDGTQE